MTDVSNDTEHTAPSSVRPVGELDAEAVAFLSAGARTGKVGWTAADGRPLMAPVWFVVEDGELVFNTEKDSAKGRALRRDPRLVLCVDLEEPPYAFVQVQGTATVSDGAEELLRTATAVATRYVGAAQAEEFGRRSGAPGSLVVRVRPTKVVAVYDMTA